jgi:hypothetical protein
MARAERKKTAFLLPLNQVNKMCIATAILHLTI